MSNISTLIQLFASLRLALDGRQPWQGEDTEMVVGNLALIPIIFLCATDHKQTLPICVAVII